jgi:GNAT superfamily N-acetyltransferase
MPVISALLDATIGRGFWDHRDLDSGLVLVAETDGTVVGVGTASLDDSDETGTLAYGRVGHVRIVAVDPEARSRGIATALIGELVVWCESHGANGLLAYAWVYGRDGVAPLATALERAGFTRAVRIENFYAGATTAPCPACKQSPCECPADVYTRSASSIRS